jgi:hypothetical protein
MLLPLFSLIVTLPRTKLEGVSMEAPWPALSIEEMKQGKVQKKVERWAERSHPLWAWAVRLTNEAVFRLTGEVSLDYGTTIQGGNEGFLWQPMYLRAFNRSKRPPYKEIRDAYTSYRRAHAFFQSKGIPLLAVINPNLLALSRASSAEVSGDSPK